MISNLTYLNVPTGIIIVIIALIVISNIIGSYLDFKGKIVPEILSFRKYLRRKKQEREVLSQLPDIFNEIKEVPETLKKVRTLLDSVDQHYSADNITMRNDWMKWVNNQATVYDTTLADLEKKINKNNELVLHMRIENMRAQILDFASTCMTHIYSREKYLEIIDLVEAYEKLLEEHGLKNGKVTISHEIILERFKYCTEHLLFLEDKLNKPYNNNNNN